MPPKTPAHKPIPRTQLIAMGASFPVDRLDTSQLPAWSKTLSNAFVTDKLQALHGQPVHIEGNERWSRVRITPQDDPDSAFNLDVGPYGGTVESNRKRLADLVRPSDTKAADALSGRFPGPNPPNREQSVHRFTAHHMQTLGLSADAGLMAAVDRQDKGAVAHYRALGADPTRYTEDGDCAARLAIAHGWTSFCTPETANLQHKVTGKTGLHELHEGAHEPCQILAIVERGADPELPDKEGRAVVDSVDPVTRQALLAARANFVTQQMERDTAAVLSDTFNPMAESSANTIASDTEPTPRRQRMRL